MAQKKRKANRLSGPSGPKEVDPADARLAVKSFEDVADSEDEYFLNRDRIDFDEQPKSKRQRRQEEEEAFLEQSDEEIFAQDDSDMGDDDAPAARQALEEDEEEGAENDGEAEDDSGWWGSSKQDYYNADNIETEADALEEEAEAKRLQKKKLEKMAEEDFVFDEGDWLAPTADVAASEDVVTEVLKDTEITEDMSPEQRYAILQARYPEFDYLADEFRELQPLLETLRLEADGKPAKSLSVVKYWILSAYTSALATYFAVLTSPTRDEDGAAQTLDPGELRDHEIMETLMACRQTWHKANGLKSAQTMSSDTGVPSPPDENKETEHPGAVDAAPETKHKKETASSKAEKKAKAKKEREIEASLADLDKLLQRPAMTSKSKSKTKTITTKVDEEEALDERSDFGEEEELGVKAAADKERKKKSLRFYTSQIVQKAAKRAEAGRDVGGDVDLPYRERFKDKQARLQAQAEKRGQRDSKHGAALEDNSSDDDKGGDAHTAGGDDEYYDMLANRAADKKSQKKALSEALEAAKRGERIVEEEVLGEDGKRKITYAIEKNKGLVPHRRKQTRNPRVKKRNQFEQKKKKLASMRPIYKGGEGRGGYQGELSGIKTGVVKSIKL